MVLDLMMPRMNGYEVLQALRADPATAELPVIIMSAKNFEVDKKTAQGLGVSLYLVKPFDFDELIGAIRRLSEPGAPAAPRPRQP
jgi:two-component system copper resistance phosphate regulon response regulator CusR